MSEIQRGDQIRVCYDAREPGRWIRKEGVRPVYVPGVRIRLTAFIGRFGRGVLGLTPAGLPTTATNPHGVRSYVRLP